jgi:hypothetical protein
MDNYATDPGHLPMTRQTAALSWSHIGVMDQLGRKLLCRADRKTDQPSVHRSIRELVNDEFPSALMD